MKKQITYEDAAFILKYEKHHWFLHWFCDWFAQMYNNNEGAISCYLKWWAYILLFLPYCITQFFYLLWDGGIKDFEILPRLANFYHMTGSTLEGDETQFGRLKIVYNKVT